MPLNIYNIFQQVIPELKLQNIPHGDDFEDFSEWMNESNQLFHYIELKEYYDNGIEDNFYLNQFKVNVDQLQNEIEADVSEIFDHVDEDVEDDDYDLDGQMDALEQVEEIIFDKIKSVAVQHQLTLIVIYRENPYWLLVPTQDEEQLDQIVDTFNGVFNADGDLNMAVY